MATDLSLLFRLGADNTQAKSVFADTRADAADTAAELRKAFGPQIAQTISSTGHVFTEALGDIEGAVQSLVSSQLEQLPAAGSLMGQFGDQTKSAAEKADLGVNIVTNSITTLSAATQKNIPRIKQSLGPELAQAAAVGSQALSGLTANLANLVGQQLPVAGGAITRFGGLLRGLGAENKSTERAVAAVADSITKISQQSGKSVPQIARFLTGFVLLENQSKRNEAAFKFFGGSVDLVGNKTARFLPELEQAGTALSGVSAESAATGRSLAALAKPIGVVIIAAAALVAGVVIVGKQLFDLTKNAAAFQGKLHDLAQEVNLTVSTLSAFEVLAKRTGGELGSITQAVVLFQRKLDDAQNPLSKTAELFRKFDISTSDTETSLRSAFAALSAMPAGFAQTNAAAELFGARGGKQVLAILKETNGDIDATIKRLGELGLLISDDAARAADKFNDELTTLEFQMRALTAAVAEDLIPAFTDLIKSAADTIRALTPLLKLLIEFSLIGIPFRAGITVVSDSLRGLGFIARAVTGDFEGLKKAIKEAREEKFPTIPAADVPAPAPVPIPGAPSPQQAASELVNQADVVIAAIKRKVAEQNQALDEFFQSGRRNRSQQAEEIIAHNRQLLKAEQDGIDARLRQKEIEFKALDEAQVARGEVIRRDTDDYRAITAEIVKLQQERLDKESDFEVQSRQLRAAAAKETADSRRNQIANETDLLGNEYDREIKATEARIARGAQVESEGLTLIEQLEQAKIDARIESVKKQREVGFLTVQNQKDIDNELIKLGQERDRLLDDQRDRRLQKDRETAERQRDLLIANIDALIQIAQTRGQRLIDAQIALAEARVITEEQAAKKILEINLGLIDAEIEATKTKLTAARSIVDVNERVRTEADLNNQIKILTEERVSIEAAGQRAIDDGRQGDLENYRDYVDELEDLTERVTRIQREAAEEVIRVLRINFASRRDIVRARLQLDLDEENERHRQTNQRLSDLERENRESRRSELEKLNIEFEINRLREAEAERHRAAMQGITDQGKKDDDEASPLGRIGLDVQNLKEFASVIEESIVPLGEILTRTFQQVADAIGQTVQNWVLLGETGPAVMRKILAQALASIAAEAAINAIKELALGFATLFFNPAESAAHFTAAALWGSIAGGAALAGRGVAGDLFKQKNADRGGAGSGSGSSGRDERDPIDLFRSQQSQELHIFLHGEPGPQFRNAVINTFVDDVRSNGPMRTTVKEVSES